MLRCRVQPIGDFVALGRRWRALEMHAPAGFFRSWLFMGCLAEQRFANAELLAVTQDGDDVALALLGSGGGRRWLNQTGDAAHDSVFIEHNGVLAAEEAMPALPGCLRQATLRGGLELSGVDQRTLQAAESSGWVRTKIARHAPRILLSDLRRPYLETISANTRSQIRRSERLYGPELRLQVAGSVTQALAWFAEMVTLHQAAWRARGQPGAFAHPHMVAFHAALIESAFDCGQTDLLRIEAGARHVGTLYNLRAGGRVYCYQSGFSYSDDNREKPGLCCHALAIAHYVRIGQGVYDFLAGSDRYKQSLAADSEELYWATLFRPWSLAGGRARVRAVIAR